MIPRLARLALVLALSCSIGLHWCFFQSVAWMGMVITYSEHTSLADALVKTFDGKHPCALCRQIAKERQSDKKSPSPVHLKKLEFLAIKAHFIFSSPLRAWDRAPFEDRLESVVLTPLTPPPRGSFI